MRGCEYMVYIYSEVVIWRNAIYSLGVYRGLNWLLVTTSQCIFMNWSAWLATINVTSEF